MRRITIRDIAREAGVSPSAVSFALNNRPGVSDETRSRVSDVAHQMGWLPNSAARALSAKTAGAAGLVIARPEPSFTTERFFFDFIIGIQNALQPVNNALNIQVASSVDEEIDIYRKWWIQKSVDGVFIVDPRENDPRPEALNEIGLPAVIVGESVDGFGAIIGNEGAVIETIVQHLTEQGCHSITYVSGFTDLSHTRQRIATLEKIKDAYDLDIVTVSPTNFTETSAREATLKTLKEHQPQAIIYENEILALSGCEAIRESGLRIGEDIAVVSCEDSTLCRIATPRITAIHRDPAVMGLHAAQLLIHVLSGGEPKNIIEDAPELEVRDSSSHKFL